ncbi:TIGR03118 family protein [Pseudaminobacter sp. 19-2017]|uniref:TIGR03118 family protein n=1 Tax=Pseudaminobacter soli (ex Zhang et al. 2022) TaxID=2831468 RepID=A0A942E2C0_9HYPH|nr:TIGR03118 family protein [Pseudaminobacter soli]MBS3651667.1 TIGR03118 family protein [Pseudaminobacter soli]
MDTVAHSRPHAQKTTFAQTNLVSDGFVQAPVIDPNLINPWGVSTPAPNRFWVSDNGTGVTTIYDGRGNPQTVAGHTAITIAAPPGQTEPSSPTGQVFNKSGHGFKISSGGKTGSSVFMFATEDGTISGWNPNVNSGSSVLAVDNSNGGEGAVYKGLAIADTKHGARLYAANFRSGKVEAYDQNFDLVRRFTDRHLPKGFAPFNVQVLDNRLFVSFALQDADKKDDVAGAGNGFVDEFDLKGNLLNRVASRGPLNSPWGLATAPKDFGKFSRDLLVGNFGDGTINAFDRKTDKFEGKLRGADGKPITIGDLWALVPGSSRPNGNPKKIYFTAGVENEEHGLFGTLSAINDHKHPTVAVHGSHSFG